MPRKYIREWDEDGPLMKQFPDEVLAIKELRELVLYGCFVENKRITVPPGIGALKELRALRLGMARITALPETLGKLTNLVELNLDGAEDLAALPASLGNLRSLQRLELQFTHKLTALPESIGKLANLKQLRAKPSGLKTVPASLWRATNLRTLDLSVKTLPPGIAKLTKLDSLDVTAQALTSIAGELPALKKLRELTVSDATPPIPDALGTLENLRDLNLTMCGLTELPAWLVKLTTLRSLQVQYNKLRGGLVELVRALPALRTVSYSGNPLPPAEQRALKQLLAQREAAS